MGDCMSAEHKITEDDIASLRNSTTFTRNQIIDWYMRFHNDCPSGDMSKEQFLQLYGELFPSGGGTELSEHIFRAYDRDGSGSVDFKEFLATLSLVEHGSLDDKLKWAFRLYDIDGSGHITLTEITDFMKATRKAQGLQHPEQSVGLPDEEQAALEVFHHLDKNRDSSISEAEFVVGCKMTPSILAALK